MSEMDQIFLLVVVHSLLLLSVVVVEVASYKGCEVTLQRRQCDYRSVEGVVATCDGYGVEEKVPHNIPANVKFLVLKNFKFNKTLTKDDFSPFKEVECMTVTNSVVRQLSRDVFENMPALRELILKGTQLTDADLMFMNHGQFQLESLTISHSQYLDRLPDLSNWDKTKQLKSLTLNYNSLRHFPTNIFTSLKSLEKLDLSYNSLENLDWAGFNNLPKLSILLLNNNHLQTIPEDVKPTFYALKKLNLGKNPWHCNCYMDWFHQFMKRHSDSPDRILDEADVHCHNGTKEAGEVRHLGSDRFTCTKPETPKIQWMELRGGKVEMICSARADPPPTLKFVTKEKHHSRKKSMIIQPSDDLSHSETSSPLIIFNHGWVSCHAENSIGSSFSKTFVGSRECLSLIVMMTIMIKMMMMMNMMRMI